MDDTNLLHIQSLFLKDRKQMLYRIVVSVHVVCMCVGGGWKSLGMILTYYTSSPYS